MMKFSIENLLDEQECYDFLVETLHPDGLKCPDCDRSVTHSRVHSYRREPILYYRCECGRVYNAFTETHWQGTHYSCTTIVQILRGFLKGEPTKHMAEELDIDRGNLLRHRHQMQERAELARFKEAFPDEVVETDEMYQNAGEKRGISQ